MPTLNQFDTESLLSVALDEKEPLRKRGSALGVLLYEIHYSYSALSNDKLGYFQIHINKTKEKVSYGEGLHFIQALEDLVNYYIIASTFKRESPEKGTADEKKTTEPELHEKIYVAFGRLAISDGRCDRKENCNDSEDHEEVKTFLALNGIHKSSLLPFIEELESSKK